MHVCPFSRFLPKSLLRPESSFSVIAFGELSLHKPWPFVCRQCRAPYIADLSSAPKSKTNQRILIKFTSLSARLSCVLFELSMGGVFFLQRSRQSLGGIGRLHWNSYDGNLSGSSATVLLVLESAWPQFEDSRNFRFGYRVKSRPTLFISTTSADFPSCGR